MLKGFLLGFGAAGATCFSYLWVVSHYIILSNEDMQALLMGVLAMYCPK